MTPQLCWLTMWRVIVDWRNLASTSCHSSHSYTGKNSAFIWIASIVCGKKNCMNKHKDNKHKESRRSLCSLMAVILLGWWRYGGMACMTTVLQWRDKDSLGRTDEKDKKVELPFMWENSWNTWSFASAWIMSWELMSKDWRADQYEWHYSGHLLLATWTGRKSGWSPLQTGRSNLTFTGP